MKSLSIQFKITGHGKFEYFPSDYAKKLEEFKKENSLCEGIMTFTVRGDDVEYWQHKYYRGKLLVPISDHSFSGDTKQAHDYLKEKFLFVKCDHDKIPSNKIERCNKYFYKPDNGPRMFLGYTPSCADLSENEMDDFIKKVEVFGFENCQLSLDPLAMEQRKYALEKIGMDFKGEETSGTLFDNCNEVPHDFD